MLLLHPSVVLESPVVKQLQSALGVYTTSIDQQLVRATSTRERYRRYLERALGIERGLESVLATMTFDWDVLARSKSSLLGRDLLALGASVEEILALPTCTAVNDVRDSIDAMGWMFAIERTSSAHWIAYHQLDHVVRDIAGSYFTSLLSHTGWNALSNAFSRLSLESDVIERLIAETQKALRTHHAWFAEGDGRITGAFEALDFGELGHASEQASDVEDHSS